MNTAAGTKSDKDADRDLRDRRGMRLVGRSEPLKTASGFKIGIAEDLFTLPGAGTPTPISYRADSEVTKEAEPARLMGSDAAKNLVLAAAAGLIVGLLLGRRDR